MTNAFQFVRQYLLYGGGVVASRFVDFLLIPVYARMLTPSGFGLLDLLLSTSLILLICGELQVISAVSRGYYEASAAGETGRLLGTSVQIYIASTLVLALAIFGGMILSRDWLQSKVSIDSWLAIPIVLSLLPRHVFSLFQLVLRFEGKPTHFLLITVGDVLCSSLFSISGVYFLDAGVIGVLWGLFLSKLIWSLALLAMYRKKFCWNFSRRMCKEILTYGLPLLPAVLAGWAQTHASRFILADYLSLSELGVFGLASRVAAIVMLLIVAFRQVWEPVATKWYGENGGEEKFSLAIELYLACGCAVCVFVSLLGAPAVALVGGPGYEGAANVVGLLAFGFMWNGALGILAAGNAWARKTFWNGWGVGIGASVNVCLLLLTIQQLGIDAAGGAFLLGCLVSAVVVYITAQKNHFIPYRLPVLASAAGFTLISIFISYQVNAYLTVQSISQFASRAGICIALFVAIGLFVWWSLVPRSKFFTRDHR